MKITTPIQNRDRQKILNILDKAIRLDESYVEAYLKKAKILFLLEKSKEADMILQQILQDHKDSLKIKEDVASAYQKDEPQLAIFL